MLKEIEMNEVLSSKLVLVHNSGDLLYPVKMKNRDTGRIAFRLSRRGNTKSDSIEVEDESEMINKITRENYMVRARTRKHTSQGGRTGLYRCNDRSIREYRLNRD